MNAIKPERITNYLLSSPGNQKDPAEGCSILLTPDSTPTKETTHDKKPTIYKNVSRPFLPVGSSSPPHLIEHSYAKFELIQQRPKMEKTKDAKDTPTRTKGRSKSDTRLDSPRPKPKQSKSAESEDEVSSTTKTAARRGRPAKSQTVNRKEKGRGRAVATLATKQDTKAVAAKAPSSSAAVDVKEKPGQDSKGKRTQRQATAKASKPEVPNKLVTDFFPIRRSSRVPSKVLKRQQQGHMEEAILANEEEGLTVVDIDGKGRGVVSTRPFHRGDFVVEYAGDLIDLSTAKERENKYSTSDKFGCYMYYFNFRNKSYCVDATAESGRLGRLLNHSKLGNCCTRVVGIGERPYLILVAAKDIVTGEELMYDYGDRSQSSLESHPWLKS